MSNWARGFRDQLRAMGADEQDVPEWSTGLKAYLQEKPTLKAGSTAVGNVQLGLVRGSKILHATFAAAAVSPFLKVT
jgi:hypothetical protein